ncbi:hypothetical protein KPL70_008030 [Citrus sinensis]|nr:hypothetical protein KPL70_008030 [Citrus sinensis]
MGSSVTLEMPPTGFFSNKKLMGFAVCAIVAFRDQHHDSDSRYSGHYEYDRKDNLYSLDCTWKVKSEGCYRDLRSWYFGTISSYVRSEHVFLGYYLFDSVELGKYYDEDINWELTLLMTDTRIVGVISKIDQLCTDQKFLSSVQPGAESYLPILTCETAKRAGSGNLKSVTMESQTVHDESELHGEQIVQSIEGTRALALQLLLAGKFLPVLREIFLNRIKHLLLDMTFWYEKYQDSRGCFLELAIESSRLYVDKFLADSHIKQVHFAANTKLGLGRGLKDSAERR